MELAELGEDRDASKKHGTSTGRDLSFSGAFGGEAGASKGGLLAAKNEEKEQERGMKRIPGHEKEEVSGGERERRDILLVQQNGRKNWVDQVDDGTGTRRST